MKLILDNIIFSLQKAGGISGAWAMLINEYLKRPELNCFFIERADAIGNIFRQDLNIPSSRILTTTHLPLVADRYMPLHLREDADFIFHSSYYRYCPLPFAKNVVTLHDFIYEKAKNHSLIARKIHSWQKRKAIANADAIVCVSHATQQDFQSRFKYIEKETNVISNAAVCRPLPHSHGDSERLKSGYVLYVGGRSGYKNFYTSVKATLISEMPLVVAGSPLNHHERRFLASLTPRLDYRVVCHPDRRELSQLYKNAFCLLYPTSFEGFGIPILEAQAHDCPVIISNCEACIETAGDGALTSLSVSAESLADKINLLKQSNIRAKVISRGRDNVTQFSWETIANDYIQLYSKLQK